MATKKANNSSTRKDEKIKKEAEIEEVEIEVELDEFDDDDFEDEVQNNDAMALFARNVKAEEAGVLVPLPSPKTGEPTDILIGLRSFRAGNARKKYERYKDRLEKARKKQIRGGKLTEQDTREINAEAFVRSGILFDIQNMQIGDEDFVYSEKAAIEMLSDPTWDVLFVLLIDMATQLDTFKQAGTEQEAKN